MPDNKKLKGKQDRERVALNDPNEVEYLHSLFPKLSHQSIRRAIKAAGPMRKDIMKYLEQNNTKK